MQRCEKPMVLDRRNFWLVTRLYLSRPECKGWVQRLLQNASPEQAMALYFVEHVENRYMDVYLGVCVALSVASCVTLE